MAYHFNNRIKIVETTKVRQRDGSYKEEEKEIAKPWTDIKTMQGEEFQSMGFTVNKIPIRFIIRYREGINTKQKVKYNNETYNIESVTNDNGKNQTLTIFATLTK